MMNTGLAAENERLRGENEILRQRIAELEEPVARLEVELARIKGQLEEAERAGKRQAAPFSKGAPKASPKLPGRNGSTVCWRPSCHPCVHPVAGNRLITQSRNSS